MSTFEVWAAGRPFSGISPEALLAKVQVLFPKATPAQLARFTAGTRFVVIRVPDEATAKRVVEALNKAGAPSEYVAAIAQPPAASLPGAERASSPETTTATRQSHARAENQPRSTAPKPQAPSKPSAGSAHLPPPANSIASKIVTGLAWFLTLGTAIGMAQGNWRALLTAPALLVAIPFISRRISLAGKVGIVVGIFSLLIGANVVTSRIEKHRADQAAVARQEAKAARIADFNSKRTAILADAHESLNEGNPGGALKIAAPWRDISDPQLSKIVTEAMRRMKGSIALGNERALDGYSAADFPQFAELQALIEQQQQRTACRRDPECMYKKSAVAASVRCKQAIEQLADGNSITYRWTDGMLDSKFSDYRLKRIGALTYLGDALEAQNGYGAWLKLRYECDFDVESGKVLDARIVR